MTQLPQMYGLKGLVQAFDCGRMELISNNKDGAGSHNKPLFVTQEREIASQQCIPYIVACLYSVKPKLVIACFF